MTLSRLQSWRTGVLAVAVLAMAGGRTVAQPPDQPPAAPPGPEPAAPLGPILPPTAVPLGTPAGAYFEPSVTVGQSFDDNLFLTTDEPVADYFTRVTPGVQAGVRTSRMLVAGSAQFDAERYTDQRQLDRLQARRYLSFDVNGLVTPRLAILGTVMHAYTTTPSELNLLSGLVLGRADAHRTGGGSSVIYQTSPRGRLSGGYNLTRDELAGIASGITHEATAEYRHAVTARTFVITDYTLRRFDFDDPLPQYPSHVFAVGVGHAFTPTTTLTLRGGPRLSATSVQTPVPIPERPAEIVREGSIAPEWSVMLQRRGRRGDTELTFARTQTTSIGQNQVIDTISAGASFRYHPASRVELRLSPAVYRDTGGVLEARVFRIAGDLTLWLTNHLAIVSQFSGSYQDSTRPPALSGPDVLTTVRQNIISVGLRATARRRVPPREPGSGQYAAGASR